MTLTTLESPQTYHSLQILTSVIHLIGSSILSYCLSRRAPSLTRWRQWQHLTWGRACIILMLLDSWIFVIFSGILSTGVGLVGSPKTCQIAIIVCILFYGSTKTLIFSFLVEKVYIVWSGGNQTPRFKTVVYKLCCTIQLGYLIVLVLMMIGRKSGLNHDQVCFLGLEAYSTIPLVSYELIQNVFFTGMFLWPFWRSHPMSPKLRVVAKRTLYAACGSLTISAINILIMIGLKGTELGWICLLSCVTDVTTNAILLFWVSSGSYVSAKNKNKVITDRFSLPQMDMSALTMSVPESALSDSTYSTPTTQTGGTVIFQPSPTLKKIPEEMFDYIPQDHRRTAYLEAEAEGELHRLGHEETLCEKAEQGKPDLEQGRIKRSDDQVRVSVVEVHR